MGQKQNKEVRQQKEVSVTVYLDEVQSSTTLMDKIDNISLDVNSIAFNMKFTKNEKQSDSLFHNKKIHLKFFHKILRNCIFKQKAKMDLQLMIVNSKLLQQQYFIVKISLNLNLIIWEVSSINFLGKRQILELVHQDLYSMLQQIARIQLNQQFLIDLQLYLMETKLLLFHCNIQNIQYNLLLSQTIVQMILKHTKLESNYRNVQAQFSQKFIFGYSFVNYLIEIIFQYLCLIVLLNIKKKFWTYQYELFRIH
ncbi:hypothetical protein ABPG74_007026 [Tetrahymena malaccensis]